jgi:hypothetical protein
MAGARLYLTAALVAGLVGSGCAPTGALLDRAAFDLQCPRGQLKLHDLNGNAKGVEGCDRRATYLLTIQNGWVMNTADGRAQESGQSR